jgi:hypothetical protein
MIKVWGIGNCCACPEVSMLLLGTSELLLLLLLLLL